MTDKPPQKRPQRPAQPKPGKHPLKRKKTRPSGQSKSFVSDQSMWGMILDIQEEELDGQRPSAKHAGKPDANPKILTRDSRAETIPIKKRKKTAQSGQNPSRNVNPQVRKRALDTPSQVNVARRSTKQVNNYVGFATREIDNTIQTQDLTDVYKKLEQERFLSYLKIPVLFFVKRWTVIVTAVLFFGLGYYIASIGHNLTDDAPKSDTRSEIKANPGNPVPEKPHPVNKPKIQFKKRPTIAPMTFKPQTKETITVQPAEDIETFEAIVPQQFDDIDITISEQTAEPVYEESDDIEIGDPQSDPLLKTNRQ